jgi:hypothetical protein
MSLIPTPTTIPKKRNYHHSPANKGGQIGATYESVYQCLRKLNNLTLPQSMNKITTNRNVKLFLAKHNLISEVKPEDNLREEYLTYRYYCISLRGQEYLKRYESFKELIS